jgi:gluconolactonase
MNERSLEDTNMPLAHRVPHAVELLDDTFRQVVPRGAVARPIADGLKFTEGPVWLPKERCLLFSDIPADTIYRWDAAQGVAVWRKPSYNANGNTLDASGRLVTCEHGSRRFTRTEPDGTVTVLAATHAGKRLNSPNDVVVKKDATIWFTDPPYGIKPSQQEQAGNYVFRLAPDGGEPVVVSADFDRPNGLCFSPDEKLLYIADSGKPHHVRRFRVTPENALEGGEVFAVIRPGVPDGMRCDAAGRLYSTAGDGVQVYAPDGKLVGRIRTPKPAANCCFGGGDGKTLFITAREAVYAVELNVRGACT